MKSAENTAECCTWRVVDAFWRGCCSNSQCEISNNKHLNPYAVYICSSIEEVG